ncbi:MAG: phosphoenolpyruvate carboxykinase (GTP) [Candidatus Omnitrophica bacterium]|nr:phosphoenolpyruvate carboxykinase (GTP) [Candidatus Omnitrophota bacterium]
MSSRPEINSDLTANSHLIKWVRESAELCNPDRIHWCDGSADEKHALEDFAVAEGILERLNQSRHPGSFYHRSKQNDVARTEQLTFICTSSAEDTGPTNNWMAPAEAYAKCADIARGSMKGRTMYVIPFIMGPAQSPFSKVGVQLTDSVYVALSMRVMARMGKIALDQLGKSDDFTRCFHAMAELDDKKRLVCHFPEDNAVWSVGSAYGGNALLGKKCLALRIASFLGRREGWLAEHMLILGIRNPEGKTHYVCAAFPSQCGKTNLAMIRPPAAMKGYETFTVGDDIAWLRIGPDGRLWAVNPEAGFFGVAPGTGPATNPVALATVQSNTIFTNVAMTPDKDVWWEGLGDPPAQATDWKGNPWTPASKEKAAHPNSRFTAPTSQCPTLSPEWENPKGVPISAIIFGGRRAHVDPLVYETFDWAHGVYTGATMGSETTAAATGQVGVVRRDPMAMRPFIGYHAGDYFRHWLEMGRAAAKPPKIFHVNWFEVDPAGKIIWPGFGDNLRVLDWILRRVDGTVDAKTTPIGNLPHAKDLNLQGLNLSDANLAEILDVDGEGWLKEVADQDNFFRQIGSRLPAELLQEQKNLKARLDDFRI